MRRNARSGVTLLQTMVALLVMAMVAMLLSTGLGGTARGFNRSGEVTNAIEHALARRELRNWLEAALPAPMPGDKRPILTGGSTNLTFLSQPRPETFWPGAPAEISLSDAPRFRSAGLDANTRQERVFELQIAPAGTTITFRYWGKIASAEAPQWHNAWPAAAGVPDLVRIDFSGGPRPLPPMVARPGKTWLQSEMSLSSLVPPTLPSRP